MTLGQIIKEYREEHGLSQDAIAERANLSKAYISVLERNKNPKTGKPPVVTPKTINSIAGALNTTFDAIFAELDKDIKISVKEQFPNTPRANISVFSEPVDNIIDFPVIASVSAGYNGLAVEEYTEEVETLPYSMLKGYPPEELRVLRVAGESMYPRFLDGDKVLIHVQRDVDDGDVAVVIYNGDEATLKQFFHIDGGVRLVAYNPEYPPKTITGADAELVHVFGKVIKLIRDV